MSTDVTSDDRPIEGGKSASPDQVRAGDLHPGLEQMGRAYANANLAGQNQSMGGPEAIDRLLQGFPPNAVDPAELPEPYADLARRLVANDGRDRMVVYEEGLADMPNARANEIRTAVTAVRLPAERPGSSALVGTVPGTKPYIVHWASEALEPQSPLAWIVDGLFPEGVSLVHGEPGAKKTWVMLDTAVCVALGQDWLGRATKQVTALVIDEESGPRRLASRLGNIMRAHGAGTHLPLAYTTLEMVNLLKDGDVSRLREVMAATGARFVVIDAFVDIMAGGDENLVKDIQPVMQVLRKLAAEFGAAIVVIHHSGKDGSYRGSSAIKGGLEHMLKIESKNGSAKIEITSQKQRDMAPIKLLASITFESDRTIITCGDAPKTNKLPGKTKQYIYLHLFTSGPTLVSDLQASAPDSGLTADAVRNALYELKDAEHVKRMDGGGQGTDATFDLTEAGRLVAEGLARESAMREQARA